MNKILVSACALAALALTFASCNKNDDVKTSEKDKSVELTIKLPAFDASMRLLGEKTVTGDKPKVQVGDIVTVIGRQGGASGTIQGSTTVALAASGTDFKGTASLPSTTDYVEVIAYEDNGTLTDNVNSRQGNAKNGMEVRLVGGGAVVSGSPNTCAVTINPEMARIELVGKLDATPYTNLQSLKVSDIYVNNIKVTRNASSLTRNPVIVSTWNTNYGVGGTFEKMTQNYSPELTGDLPVPNTADGYNIFPQEIPGSVLAPYTKDNVGPHSPHIILKVSYQTKVAGAPVVTDKYLNVVALKESGSGDIITKFEAGKVYQLQLQDIAELMDKTVPPVTPNPDPDQLSVELTVTVGQWTVVPVKPVV